MQMTKRIVLFATGLLIVAGAGCYNQTSEVVSGDGFPKALEAKVGTPCTVQIRRDALGSGHELPVPPTTDVINGAQVSVSGTLEAVHGSWIVLDTRDPRRKHWIPAGSVLLLSFNVEEHP
jgi:hypothetical protein